MAKKAPIPVTDCGMAQAIEILGDRWSLLILREALYGVTRFDDIRADIGIPKSVLSQRLGALVDQGILTKQMYKEDGKRARYAYVPTEAGREFALPLLAIMQWGDKHVRDNNSRVTMHDSSSGQALSVGLVREDGTSVPLEHLRLKLTAGQ